MLLAVAAACAATAAAQELLIDSTKQPDLLYVLTAREGNFAGRTLTLQGVSPVTLVFSDRPARSVGQLLTSEFVARFSRQADEVDSDPPNALLSIIGARGSSQTVLELRNPKLTGDTLRWERIRLLRGSLPSSFDVCTLLLEDAFGSPVLEPPDAPPRSAQD